jgi:FMN phosphatase YigB (HAD superfamily)
MSITLLLDLDDTLLQTNTEVFLPAYYKALASHLSGIVPGPELLEALQLGVQRMMLNHDPSRTLQEVFEGEFFPRLDVPADALRAQIADFYLRIYPKLGQATRTIPGAQELMLRARSTGHKVALATDPVFPMVATAERVRWGGLDPGQFDLISSFETFHFTKSHTSYFAEVLGRLGWPDQPVIMAGNDVERDLLPAERLGLTTFHVNRGGDGAREPGGDLAKLWAWIQANEAVIKPPAINTKEAILAVLEATPAVLQSITAALTPAQWVHEASDDEWAMVELVCHLRDTEREVHSQQVATLIESNAPFVARPDAAVWAKQRPYLGENGPHATQQFAEARLACLERLQSAPEDAWAKPARHAIFGPTNFLEAAGFMAEHDRLHLRQAWRILQGESELAHLT